MSNKEVERKIYVSIIIAILLSIVVFESINFMGKIFEEETPSEDIFSTSIFPSIYGLGYFQNRTSYINELEYTAFAPQYTLPLNLSEVVNYQQILSKFPLNNSQKEFLRNNGFIAISIPFYDDFAEMYKAIAESGLPVFITSDSILHVYHSLFEDILMTLEEEHFIPWMKKMTLSLVERADEVFKGIPQEESELKNAAKMVVCYLSIPAKILNDDFQVPSYTSEIVTKELNLIENHEKMTESPLFGYEEDYTQYKPRGHYTENKEFEKYFKAMMWFGRMYFKVKSKEQTLAALILVKMLNEAKINLDNTEIRVKELWEKIYLTTSFIVGFSDDLTIYDYEEIISQVYGEEFSLLDLNDKEKLEEVQDKLMKRNKSKIISSPIYPSQKEEVIGLRFMGQRFIPDSYIFQQLVFDNVQRRLMPKGLDVATVLGSKRAEEHLKIDIEIYPKYEEQLEKLKQEFSQLTVENWTQNLYWGWLYSLKATIKNFTQGFPTFMQTEAWKDEKLNTFLGSWAELRHDTILYAKQSYTLKTSLPEYADVGYVEPIPELYHRLYHLCQMTINGLDGMDMLNEIYKEKLSNFSQLLDKLKEISIKELNGEELTKEEIHFILNIGHKLEEVTSGLRKRTVKSILIADVHTDPNTMKVLEVGCGFIDYIVVIVKLPNEQLYAMVGPIFTYYEFTWPVNQRLTDEEWRNILTAGRAPDRLEWIKKYYG